MAITNDQNLVLKIVAGLFDAAPGKSNFDALSSSLTSGSTPLQIAEALDSIPAFASTALGSATTTQAKVDALMSNFGLSVAGDLNPNSAASQAYAYFTQAINAGQSLGRIVFDAVAFLSGSVPAEFATTATLLSNKAAVAEHYSVTQGVSGATLADLQTVLSGVTATTDVSTPAALDAVIAKVTDSVAPVATAATFSFAENATTATVLGTVTATDNSAVTGFEIVSGNDSGFFAIDSKGQVTLTEAGTKSAANNFETTPNSFTIGVKAVDAAGNKSEAVNTILNVTDVDDVAPAFVGATAATGSNKVTVNFGEALKAGNPAATAFTVKDGTTTVGVTAAAVNGSAVTLTLASNIAGTVTVAYDSANAVNKLQDAAGNLTANFDGKTASSDVTAPTLSSSTPTDGGTLGKADNIVLTFSEDVVLGSGGNITIVNSGDSKDTRTIAVNDASQVTVSGTKVTINPTADLVESGAYYINIPNGAISDKAGNAYAGISDATTLNFTGAAASVTPVAGQTFTLTTNIDNIAGTTGNDTIIGDFGITGQVSAADQINGGLGTDELQLYGTFGTLPVTVTGVEKLNLSGYGDNKTINVSTLTGITDLVLRNQTTQATGDTTVTIAAGQAVTLNTVQDSANAANEVIITGASSITSNTLVLDKAGDAATGGNDLEIEIQGTGVKTLNLQTANNASRISLQDETTTGDFAVDTINITGDKNLTVDALAASSATKVTIAANTFTGALNLALTVAENFEVTGGTGGDRFNFAGNLDASDKVAGGDGTDTLATSTATVDATFAGVIDGKTNSVANNSSLEVLEYTGTGAYTLNASLIQMSTLKTYSTTGAIAPAQAAGTGTTAGTTAMAVTGQSNAQTFSIEANVTGGAGATNTATNAAGGNGAAGVTFAPAVNNGDNTLNLSLKGVTITGGAAGANTAQASGTGASGGNAADFSTFETINITSTGATTTAVNTFTGGAGAAPGTGTTGSTGSTFVVSANAKINISGANEINLGTISNSNQPVTIDASSLTGKMTVGTGTAADVVKGGSGINLITLAGGADSVTLSASTAKADVITVTAATNTTSTAYISVTGFSNSGTTTIGDKLDVIGTASIQADVSSGTATGVTNLTGSVSSGIMSFAGSAAATATLANKIAAAASSNFAGAQNEVVAFEHNGNTYIMHQAGATANAFNDGEDTIIELIGVTGVTALSTTASGATTVWVA